MKVTAYCGSCLKGARFETDAAPAAVVCTRCGGRREVKLSERVREGTLNVCALCGCGHFYVEKDFNAWLGGAILLAAVAGFVWAQSFSILLAFGFLAAAAGLDLAMFALRPMRAICYQCLATYRGARPNPEHKPYDLGLAARYADDYEERRRSR